MCASPLFDILNEICTIWYDMFERQQRDMRQGGLVDLFLLCPQLLDNVGDFERVPIQDRVGHQAEAASLVHDLLVVSRREFSLVGKENPAGELMAIFAFVGPG
jgi:hypothetical protein